LARFAVSGFSGLEEKLLTAKFAKVARRALSEAVESTNERKKVVVLSHDRADEGVCPYAGPDALNPLNYSLCKTLC
jgi:hypothetical protein